MIDSFSDQGLGISSLINNDSNWILGTNQKALLYIDNFLSRYPQCKLETIYVEIVRL